MRIFFQIKPGFKKKYPAGSAELAGNTIRDREFG
jgi:hypothetical protein